MGCGARGGVCVESLAPHQLYRTLPALDRESLMAFQMRPRPKTAGRNCSRAFFFVAIERQFCHSRVVTFVPHTSEPFTRHGHPSHTVSSGPARGRSHGTFLARCLVG